MFFAPADVYLRENDVVQPDVFFVTTANLGILKEDGAYGAPDLVVEVLSPRSAALKKMKRRVYARQGVKAHWLVDPTLRQIHLYEFAREPAKAVRVVDEHETIEVSQFPDLRVPAADLFRR